MTRVDLPGRHAILRDVLAQAYSVCFMYTCMYKLYKNENHFYRDADTGVTLHSFVVMFIFHALDTSILRTSTRNVRQISIAVLWSSVISCHGKTILADCFVGNINLILNDRVDRSCFAVLLRTSCGCRHGMSLYYLIHQEACRQQHTLAAKYRTTEPRPPRLDLVAGAWQRCSLLMKYNRQVQTAVDLSGSPI